MEITRKKKDLDKKIGVRLLKGEVERDGGGPRCPTSKASPPMAGPWDRLEAIRKRTVSRF